MFEEKFAQGKSFLHLADPRLKILGVLAFSLASAWVENISAASLSLALSLLLFLLSNLPLGMLLKRLLLVNGLIFFLWIFLPFSVPGKPLFCLMGLCASAEGLILSGLITLKSNSILIAVISLLSTSRIPDLGKAMQRLHAPNKFILLLLITYRYLQVIAEEYSRLYTAALSRGFVPGTNVHTYKTFANLVGMLLIKSFERAERVYQAMLLRGFNGTFHSLQEFSICTRDLLLLGYLVAGTLMIIFVEIMG